ncbi:MAG: hypothetical protein ACRYGI_11460 [Janthinobacterium lividum]
MTEHDAFERGAHGLADPIAASVQAAIDSDGMDDAGVVEAMAQAAYEADTPPIMQDWEQEPRGVREAYLHMQRHSLSAYKRHMEMF